jgi:hypothetical protein
MRGVDGTIISGRRSCIRSGAASLGMAAFFLIAQSTISSSGEMSLPGKFSVTALGAANYSIPIALPPGTAGVAPSLSLSYSSLAGGGLLGMGWTLDGLPAITRCSMTVAQDQALGSINFDANDRFCMEGQRLVVTSNTAYGADNTQYDTEIRTFSEIISHGTAGNGPAWFEVHTKSGQVMEFGHTTDSQILAQGKTTVKTWALNKVSDSKTNYFLVTYTNDTINGQYYPARIDYTGNSTASVAPYNSVQFVYAARPDAIVTYQGGSLSQTTMLLTDVMTYAGTSLVADYKLAYSQGNATGRSRINSVVVCSDSGGTTCLPGPTLSWSDDITPGTFSSAVNLSAPGSGYVPMFADINGDGKTDLVWCSAGCATASIQLSNGDGTFANGGNVSSLGSGYVPLLVDYNGDGNTDVLWCSAYGPGSGFAVGSCSAVSIPQRRADGTLAYAPIAAPAAGYIPLLGDANGDGQSDFFWCNAYGPSSGFAAGSCSALSIQLSQGGGYAASSNNVNLSAPGAGYIPRLADLNGDGMADVLWCNAYAPTSGYAAGSCSALSVQLTSMSTSGLPSFTSGSNLLAPGSGYIPLLGDVNGDGKADVLWCNAYAPASGYAAGSCSALSIQLSKGDGSFTSASNLAAPGSGYIPLLADVNGDGKADVLWCNAYAPASGNAAGSCSVLGVQLSKGDGSFTSVSNLSAPGSGYIPLFADINGDGKADFLWCNAYPSTSGNPAGSCSAFNIVQSSTPPQSAVIADLLLSVTDGFGLKTSISYLPLTNSSFYTKDATAIFPGRDFQFPLNVVSRVDAPNGVGGMYSSTYSYAGGKTDLSGRGFLGFRQMVVKDLQTGIIDTTTYRQDFPLVGLVSMATRSSGTQVLGQSSNLYQVNSSGGPFAIKPVGPFTVLLLQNVSSGFDLDGSALPTVTTAYQYDTFGNATQVMVYTPDGFSKTTTNVYTNDTTHWYLGRLTRATVVSSAP